MRSLRHLSRTPLALRAQRGVILFIALIVLVAMTLAGIALMRSVDTNVLISGNLAFRQATTNLADLGVEAARGWLSANGSQLSTDQPGGFTAYWANWQQGLDFIGQTATTSDDFNWSTAQSVTSPDPAYSIAYVIHRMCQAAGDPTAAASGCMNAVTGSGGGTSGVGSRGTTSYGTMTLPGTSTVFYRVTVRVIGPRRTVSYVQTMLN